MPTTAASQDDALPIVVGVTGHRQLRAEDETALRNAVRGILAILRADYPNSPLWVISPLAEGADRLVARIGCEEFGARLVAALPLSEAEYKRDFGTAESVAEFESLVACADVCVVLPPMSSDDASVNPAARNRQYAAAGALVVRCCQVLIALWDGEPSDKVGATAQVVDFQRLGIPREYRIPSGILDGLEVGSVQHVYTPRTATPTRTPGSLNELVPPGTGEAEQRLARRRLANVESFNADAQRLGGKPSAKDYMITPYAAADFSPAVRRLLERYALADALAKRYQNRTTAVFLMLMLIAFAAATALQVYLSIPQPPWALLALYAGGLASLTFIYWLFRRRRYESKYLDYRALAEGLRVQIYWRLAGLADSVADYYLRRQRGELDWIRTALRACHLADAEPALAPEAALARLQMVQQNWVHGQHEYFTERGDDFARQSWWLRKLGKGLLWIGIALAVVRVFLTGDALLLLLVAMLPIVAGLLQLYSRARAFGEHAKQYLRMAPIYGQAAKRLEELIAARDIDAARELLRELGEEALAENGDWLILHRDRPLESPGL